MTKEEYISRKDELGQAHCMGCHKPVICDLNTSVQYYDIDSVLLSK